MFVDLVYVDWRDSITNRSRVFAKLTCDFCQTEFRRSQSYQFAKFHFCSRKCQNDARVDVTSDYSKSIRETLVQKFGSVGVLCDERIRNKYTQTSLNRYGTEHPSSSPTVREKLSKSLINANVERGDQFLQKRKESNLLRYGVEFPSQNELIKAKVALTFKQRYGGRLNQSSTIKSKIQDTMKIRYGVTNPMQNSTIVEKNLRTRMINSTKSWSSHIENEFYICLCKRFGELDVLRQVRVFEFRPDFYIRSIDTYVEFDGVYWHGLDRTQEQLRESNSIRDKSILKKWQRDREQDRFFSENHLRLVRITDSSFKKDHDKVLDVLGE